MKTAVFIILCIGLLLMTLCSCGAQGTPASSTSSDSGATVVFHNQVQQADIWILPQTEEIQKTTVWGTATIAGLAAGQEKTLSLDALGGPGVYVVRIIDRDEAYYAVNDLELTAGCSIRFYMAEDILDARVDLLNAAGDVTLSQEAFVGVL